MTKPEDAPIKIIESSRLTHVHWREFLKSSADYPIGDVGDIPHHEECIVNYDKVLEALKAPALTPEEQRAIDAINDAMEAICALYGGTPHNFSNEGVPAIHVLQGFVKQHYCHRMNPDAWSQWKDEKFYGV